MPFITLLNEPGAEEEDLLEAINMDCDVTVPKVLESPITATDSQILHTADDTASVQVQLILHRVLVVTLSWRICRVYHCWFFIV